MTPHSPVRNCDSDLTTLRVFKQEIFKSYRKKERANIGESKVNLYFQTINTVKALGINQ